MQNDLIDIWTKVEHAGYGRGVKAQEDMGKSAIKGKAHLRTAWLGNSLMVQFQKACAFFIHVIIDYAAIQPIYILARGQITREK